MKQEFRSPRYTTKWLEMRRVRWLLILFH
jgi:hypothetical protein